MGKTPTPLSILVAAELKDHPEWESLRQQGHTVVIDEENGWDIIVGPRCWRLFPRLMKYLPLALKEARAAKAKRPKRAATD